MSGACRLAFVLLKQSASLESFERMFKTIHDRLPAFRHSAPVYDMAALSFDYHRYAHRVPGTAHLSLSDQMDVSIRNLETKVPSQYSLWAGCKQIVSVDYEISYWSVREYFEWVPWRAVVVTRLMLTICTELDAFCAYFGHPNDVTPRYGTQEDNEDVIRGLEVVFNQEFPEFATFYMDNQLVEAIGMDILKAWAPTIEPVNDVGYLVYRFEYPFISGTALPQRGHEERRILREHIGPAIIERYRAEVDEE